MKNNCNQPQTTVEQIKNQTAIVLQEELNGTNASAKYHEKLVNDLTQIIKLCDEAIEGNEESLGKMIDAVSEDPYCWSCIPNFGEYEETNTELCVAHPIKEGCYIFSELKY